MQGGKVFYSSGSTVSSRVQYLISSWNENVSEFAALGPCGPSGPISGDVPAGMPAAPASADVGVADDVCRVMLTVVRV